MINWLYFVAFELMNLSFPVKKNREFYYFVNNHRQGFYILSINFCKNCLLVFSVGSDLNLFFALWFWGFICLILDMKSLDNLVSLIFLTCIHYSFGKNGFNSVNVDTNDTQCFCTSGSPRCPPPVFLFPLFIFIFFLLELGTGFVPHPAVFRTYSGLCAQWSLMQC